MTATAPPFTAEDAEDCLSTHLRRRSERIRLIWRIDSVVIPRSASDEDDTHCGSIRPKPGIDQSDSWHPFAICLRCLRKRAASARSAIVLRLRTLSDSKCTAASIRYSIEIRLGRYSSCPDPGSRTAVTGSFYRPCLRSRGVTGMRHAHKLLPMRRSLWTRVIALFVGIWFVAAAAGPELTHACPMHGGHSSAASAAEHADHGAVAEHHPASSSESPSHHGTQCTCLGQCCSTGPVAVLSARTALGDTDTVATRDAGLPDYAYVPVAAQHVLPLANAPPLSA